MRSRKKPWTQNELNTNKYLVEYPQKNIGRWREAFGADRPIYIEIGCGKGGFITEAAKRRPDISYVAIEKEPVVIAAAIRRAREETQPENLLFCAANAEELGYIFDKGEAARLYLNFSDPWDSRKKWAKRRLTHRNFLSVYEKILNPVELYFKTDNRILFDFTLSELKENGFEIVRLSEDLHNSPYAVDNIMTEYEKKFSGQGKNIFFIAAVKRV